MPDVALDRLISALGEAVSRTLEEADAATVRAHRIRNVTESVINLTLDEAIVALSTDAQRMREATDLVQGISKVMQDVRETVDKLIEAVEDLATGLISLDNSEIATKHAIERSGSVILSISDKWSNQLPILNKSLEQPLETVTVSAEHTSAKIDTLRDRSNEIVDRMAEALATFSTAFDQIGTTFIADNWDQLITRLDGNLVEMKFASAAAFERCENLTSQSVFDSSQRALDTVSENADSVGQVLKDIRKVVETAKMLQSALRASSGGFS